jgi:hypothetical protein
MLSECCCWHRCCLLTAQAQALVQALLLEPKLWR